MEGPGKRARWLIVLAALCCSACFEQPIDERLSLEFNEDGSVEIEITVEFSDLSGEHHKAALLERVAERRQALLDGRDDWTRRFDPLESVSERSGWEKESGDLKRCVHSAVLAEPQRDLRRFFSDTDVTVFYERRGDDADLALAPGSPTRADRRQRERVRRHIDGYAESIADYIEAAAALWDYLHHRPERARATLGQLFGDLLSDEVRESLDPTDDEEDQLLDALNDAMKPVADVLEVDDDEAYSLDELSRLVYDPFPAEITVSVPGNIELLEGFAKLDDGRLRIRPSGFWEAFVSLEGDWLTPDPLVAFVRATVDETPFDLEAFIARERRIHDVPNPAVVKEALAGRLRPAANYRVVWRTDPAGAGPPAASRIRRK